jgi:trimeric autotransporter adhesin
MQSTYRAATVRERWVGVLRGTKGKRMRVFFGLVACAQLGTLWAQSYVISTVAGGNPAPAAASAISVALGLPGRIATDPSGNVYFTALNSVFRLSGGAVTRVAGNGLPGYSGDGGPALSAQLNNPQGMAIDSAGDIYIADMQNQVVRYVAGATGIITTVAGNGTPGMGGDYGIPTLAQLDLPTAVALDASNNLYICDSANNVIRTVSNGVISPYLGNYIPGFSGDTTGTISMNNPTDIFFDSGFNLWIADYGNGRVREYGTNGITSTVAGGGTTYTEGGFATASVLAGPHSLVVDSAGNVYIADADDNRVRKITTANLLGPEAVITTFAGAGVYGFAGDGGAAKAAELNTPNAVGVDPSGNVYFVDLFNFRVRMVASSGTINTVAGNGVLRFAGDGAPAQDAQMSGPSAVAVSAVSGVSISDTNNQRIRQINSAGIISTVAGNGTPGFAGDGGAAASAQIAFPEALATDASGNLYFADTGNQRVRKIANGTISTIAGNGATGYSGDGGAAISATLNSPSGLAFDSAGNLYIADYGNNVIRKVSNGVISTVAGSGLQAYAGDGGLATSAGLNGPLGLALDASGNLYIADSGNHVVRIVTPGGVIGTFAGNGNLGDSGDGGLAVNAQLASPYGVAVDASGAVYISDSGASRIRMVIPGGLIITIAGTGSAGYSGDGGPGAIAQLSAVEGIALDGQGDLYIADQGNNVIRMLQLVSRVPSAGAVVGSATNLMGPVAPGEWVTIYGSGLGPSTLTTSQPDAFGNTPLQLAGTVVYFNGVPAPIFYTWSQQVGVVVPYEVTPGSAVLAVQFGNQVSLELTVPVAASAPGLFTANGSGTGQALALNQGSQTWNTSASPVPQGTVITLYATGSGQGSPPVPDGTPNGAGFDYPVLPVTATIGGVAAGVGYVGGDTGLPPGMIRVDLSVPSGVTGSAVPVAIKIGSASSQPGVTIAVK